MKATVNYLEMIQNARQRWSSSGVATPTQESFTLKNGTYFETASALPDDLSILGPYERGFCYRNANELALAFPRYLYVEGWACPSSSFLIPLAHAWLYDTEEQKFVDPTWGDEGVSYLGVAFSRNFLMEFNLVTGYWGIFGSDELKRLHGYLTDGFPIDALVQIP